MAMLTNQQITQQLVRVVNTMQDELDQSPDNTAKITLKQDLLGVGEAHLSSNVAKLTLRISPFGDNDVMARVDMHNDVEEDAQETFPSISFPIMRVNIDSESTFRDLLRALTSRSTFRAIEALLRFSRLTSPVINLPADPVEPIDSDGPDTNPQPGPIQLYDTKLEGFHYGA